MHCSMVHGVLVILPSFSPCSFYSDSDAFRQCAALFIRAVRAWASASASEDRHLTMTFGIIKWNCSHRNVFSCLCRRRRANAYNLMNSLQSVFFLFSSLKQYLRLMRNMIWINILLLYLDCDFCPDCYCLCVFLFHRNFVWTTNECVHIFCGWVSFAFRCSSTYYVQYYWKINFWNFRFKLFVARTRWDCNMYDTKYGQPFANALSEHEARVRDCQHSINRINNLTILIFIGVDLCCFLFIFWASATFTFFLGQMKSSSAYQFRCLQIIIRRIRSFSFLVCRLCCLDSVWSRSQKRCYMATSRSHTIHAEWYRKPIIIIVSFEHNHESWTERKA